MSEGGSSTGGGPPPRRARWAVAVVLFTNGAMFANLAPRYPQVKAQLALSDAAFGAAISAGVLGALVLGLLGGGVVARFGSARVAAVTTVAIAGTQVLVTVAPSWAVLAGALFVLGAADAVADLAANTHALRVERRYGRSILNSLHAVWSIGAVVGGVMGAAAAGAGVPLGVHLATSGALLAAAGLIATRSFLPGSDHTERPGSASPGPASSPRAPRRWFVGGRLLALGVLIAMAQSIEDTGATWAAVYLREDLGTGAGFAGAGFIALQGAQTVGRLLGDRAVSRYGDRTVARTGAGLAGAAMAVALALPTPVNTVAAFAAVGLGIATVIPAAMRTADALPGPPGLALSVIGTIERVTVLITPLLIGVTAEAYTLQVGLIAIPAAAAVILLLTRTLPTAHGRADP